MTSRPSSHGAGLRRVTEALQAYGLKLRHGRCPCPAHSGYGNGGDNLSVRQGEKGAALKCHSHECSTAAILAAIGLPVAAQFDDYDAAPSTSGKRELVATFYYTNETNAPAYRVHRLEWYESGERKKTFRQERWDAVAGKYIGRPGAMTGIRRLLYRLPNVLRAIAAGETIYVHEGEKAADALHERFGLTGTTAPEGAGKWLHENAQPPYAESLRGAHVVLLPDNEDKGRKHMATAAGALIGTAASVRIVTLPNLPEKGDIVEWLEAGGTRDELDALVAATPVLTTAPVVPDDVEHGPTVHMVSLDQVTPERVRWVHKPYLPHGKIVIIEGPVDKGKTTLCIHCGAAMTKGQPPFGGVAVGVDPMDVLFVSSSEDGLRDTIRPRAEAAGATLSRFHVLEGIGDDCLPLILPDNLAALEAAIVETQARLVIFDNLVAMLSKAVNSWKDQDVRVVLSRLARLAERRDVTILLVRHVTKMAHGTAVNAGGGTIGIIGQARVALLCDTDPDTPDGYVVAIVKCNNAKWKHLQSLRYTLESDEKLDCSRLVWTGESARSADDLTQQRAERGSAKRGDVIEQASAVDEAVSWLSDVLAPGDLDSHTVKTLARKTDISVRTLDRARKKLGVTAEREGFGKDCRTTWKMPSCATLSIYKDDGTSGNGTHPKPQAPQSVSSRANGNKSHLARLGVAQLSDDGEWEDY